MLTHPRLALPSLLLALLLSACAASAPHRPTDATGEHLQARHEAAVGAAQRLTLGAQTDPSPPCLEICRATVDACVSADAVCEHEGVGDRCHAAHQGCDWSVSMLPRACRYCLP